MLGVPFLISQTPETIQQGHSKQSSWSCFGWTTISQGKNKILFYKEEVINKSARVYLDLLSSLYYDTVDRKSI